MLQFYKVPEELPNYIPYGMALRAIGQDMKTCLVTDSKIIETLGPYLKGAFEELFFYSSWDGFKTQRIEEHALYLLDRPPLSILEQWYLPEFKEMGEITQGGPEVALFGSYDGRGLLELAGLVTEVSVDTNKSDLNPRAHIKVITGNGKGKTTYALGEALYYASQGIPSLVIQFIKSPKEYGEVKASKRLGMFQIRSMGKGFPPEANVKAQSIHERAARDTWNYFLSILNRPAFGLVVLDEINIALKYGYLRQEEVAELLLNIVNPRHLLLTGRYADLSLFPYSDLVIEMKEIKHPYKMGIKARKGIEF